MTVHFVEDKLRRIPAEYKKLGVSIRTRRKDLHFTQKYVADKTGTSASFVSQVESGKLRASDKFLWSLEKVLELPEGTLFLKVGRLTMLVMRTLTPKAEQTDIQLLNQLVGSMNNSQLAELLAYARFLSLQTHMRELAT
jgi:transcriptional regulator with XRE-family HTH domain